MIVEQIESTHPDPLEHERDPVRPLVLPVQHPAEDTGGKHLTEDPAQVDICHDSVSQRCRGDFGCVCSSHGLISAQRETEEDLTSEEHLDTGSKDR